MAERQNRPPRAKRKWTVEAYQAENGRWYVDEQELAESFQTIQNAGTYLGGGFTVMPIRVKLENGDYETRGWQFAWENAPTIEEHQFRNWWMARNQPANGNGHVAEPEPEPGLEDFIPDLEPEPVSGD